MTGDSAMKQIARRRALYGAPKGSAASSLTGTPIRTSVFGEARKLLWAERQDHHRNNEAKTEAMSPTSHKPPVTTDSQQSVRARRTGSALLALAVAACGEPLASIPDAQRVDAAPSIDSAFRPDVTALPDGGVATDLGLDIASDAAQSADATRSADVADATQSADASLDNRLSPDATSDLPATRTWTRITETGPNFGAYAMTYDEVRMQPVMFGYQQLGGSGPYAQTWVWNGRLWDSITPTSDTRPGLRFGHSLVYARDRQRVVLFGGTYSGGANGETWELSDRAWRQATVAGPGARQAHAMAFDADRNVVVLFGGYSGNRLSDTWEWNGTVWNARSPAHAPSARTGHAMVFDSVRHRVLLFGGSTPSGIADNTRATDETWSYDGVDWTLMHPPHAPSPRTDHAMVFDADSGQTILVNGTSLSSTAEDGAETWAFDGRDWRQVVTHGHPDARYGHTMTFDAARHQIVLFGGSSSRSDTWVLRSNP